VLLHESSLPPCAPPVLPLRPLAPCLLLSRQFYSSSRPGTVISSFKFGVYIIYIYIIYTPNLGLEIAVSGREREQGCFRGSSEGAAREQEGAGGSRGGARGSNKGARGSILGQYRGVAGRSLK